MGAPLPPVMPKSQVTSSSFAAGFGVGVGSGVTVTVAVWRGDAGGLEPAGGAMATLGTATVWAIGPGSTPGKVHAHQVHAHHHVHARAIGADGR